MSVTSGTKTESGVGETIRVVIHALLIALVIRTFLFQPFNIPSGSMKATLLVGDYLFVSKYSYGYSPFSIPLTPPLPELSPRTAVSPLTTGSQVSLFPADGAVFRVKANLASAVIPTSGQKTNGERQYWVDVRIANDGTMRIMQVLPAERSRIVPRE